MLFLRKTKVTLSHTDRFWKNKDWHNLSFRKKGIICAWVGGTCKRSPMFFHPFLRNLTRILKTKETLLREKKVALIPLDFAQHKNFNWLNTFTADQIHQGTESHSRQRKHILGFIGFNENSSSSGTVPFRAFCNSLFQEFGTLGIWTSVGVRASLCVNLCSYA